MKARAGRSVLVACLTAMLLGTLVGSDTAGAATDGLSLVAVRQSLLGAHHWYQQTYRGLPVLDGYLAKHFDNAGRLTRVADGRRPILNSIPERPSVSSEQARDAARRSGAGTVEEATLTVLPGKPARLVWAVFAFEAGRSNRALVDAFSGRVLRVESLVKELDGTGKVFDPNPVVTLQDQSLRDQSDTDYAALQPAYRTVTLSRLDGSGYLRGDFANIAIKQRRKLAFSDTQSFVYGRTDDRFEQVMAYYAVTEAQLYIQSLGFTNLNNESQDLLTNTIADDNSFYNPRKDTITLGAGGVDDAEDADVTWHELGHAMQHAQVPGYGAGHSADTIGEGFSDYWAVTMSQPVNGGYEVPCVADWDSTAYTSAAPHCLRRVDTNKTVANQTGEVHDDGEIWSRALWDINQGLGRDVANRIILEAQFGFAPDTSFGDAAQVTVDTARLLYGGTAADTVRAAFQDRGLL